MSHILPRHFLLSAELLREKVPSFDEYPFNIPAIHTLEEVHFHPSVTFLVGENGSGKSTFLEAIAIALGFNAEGGSKNFRFSTHDSHSSLSKHLRVARGTRRPTDGYFLRAESFFNVATAIDSLEVNKAYGETSLHQQSHGEAFLSLLTKRFRGNGLYLLDEPEAALSPTRQLATLVRMRQLIEEGSQFIIATHSPILMAYPGATILALSEEGMETLSYEETEHFYVTRQFLNNYPAMLRELFKEE